MAKKSRDKGKRGEREVAKLFRDWGFPARRTAQVDGGLTSDVLVYDPRKSGDETLPLHVEIKRHKRIAACRFMDQAESDRAPEATPAVFLREDGGEWLVLCNAPTFLKLLERWYNE